MFNALIFSIKLSMQTLTAPAVVSRRNFLIVLWQQPCMAKNETENVCSVAVHYAVQ